MAIKLDMLFSIGVILMSFVDVGYSIKCHAGGLTPDGSQIPEMEFDCTMKIPGIVYLNKCVVSQVKNSTHNFITRGCVPDIDGVEAQMCNADLNMGGTIMKGCCCQTELCNNEAFQKTCLGATTIATTTTTTTTATTTTTTTKDNGSAQLSTNIIFTSLVLVAFKLLVN